MMKKIILLLVIPIFSLFAWEEIGPIGFSANRVLPDPTRPDSIYAIIGGGASERRLELVRTPDRGASWDSLGEYESAVLHPATAETVFASLGIGSFSDGVWRSNDFGRTFEFPPPDWLYLAKGAIYDPRDPSRLFAWGSTIDRSTDGGSSWEVVYSTIGTPDMYFTGVAVDPVYNHRVYAWDGMGRLFHSLDYGSSWRLLFTFTEHMSPNEIAVSPRDSCILYAACWCGFAFSRNCGFDWEYVDLDPQPSNCIFVQGGATEHIYIGGAYGALASEDEGMSWAPLGDDIPCAVFDIAQGPEPSGGQYLYVGTERFGAMRMPIGPSSEGPIVGPYSPLNGAWVSLDSFAIFVGLRDPDGIDEASLIFSVNDVEFDCSNPQLSLADSGMLFISEYTDGETLHLALERANDCLGNPSDMLPLEWTIYIDRSPAAMLYRHPDSADVVIGSDITAKFYIRDLGAGIDTSTFYAVFGSDTVRLSSMAAIFDADTFIIHLPTAGISPAPGETVSVEVGIADKATFAGPNSMLRRWFFSVSPTGLSEASLPSGLELSVHPNPFNSALTVETNLPVKIEIIDISGRSVAKLDYPGGVAHWQPDVSIRSGLYLLLIRTERGEVFTRKIFLLK